MLWTPASLRETRQFALREWCRPARVVVGVMGENDRGNIVGRIKSQLTQPRANLLMGSNPDTHCLVKNGFHKGR